jgi:transposase
LKKEEGWHMYIEIQHLKEKGFSNSKISRMLNLSRPTVIKYSNMSPDKFNQEMESRNQRSKKPAVYHDDILAWLRLYPDMSASQVYDWLEEKYKELKFNESTTRNYVRWIRKEYGIPKDNETRQYGAPDDPPFGKQIQVDFGEIKVTSNTGNRIRLFVMCFVLSNSRYKYCEWQDRPFTTEDIIKIHENAFDFYGGMPEEIVYDQDHLILTSENHGDLVFTHAFANYIKKRKFKVYMCRRADPESKGRIENVVGYVKNNFAIHRKFYNLDRWNEDCYKWLHRRGNGKIHSTTRKIPAEVFIEERKYLQPVLEKIKLNSTGLSLTYQVRKDNTVPVAGNRYSVPRGTYKGPDTYVKVSKIENRLIIIMDIESDKELARYEIPSDKGNLLKNNNHKRDSSTKIPALLNETVELFRDQQKALSFLENIYKGKPRYIRDQLSQVKAVIKDMSTEVVDKALNFCIKNHLYSSVDFKDAVIHYEKTVPEQMIKNSNEIVPLSAESIEKIRIKPEVRNVSEYARILTKSMNQA